MTGSVMAVPDSHRVCLQQMYNYLLIFQAAYVLNKAKGIPGYYADDVLAPGVGVDVSN